MTKEVNRSPKLTVGQYLGLLVVVTGIGLAITGLFFTGDDLLVIGAILIFFGLIFRTHGMWYDNIRVKASTARRDKSPLARMGWVCTIILGICVILYGILRII